MDIYPAIDLQNGKCVRLTQGDFAQSTIYADDPAAQALAFQSAGAEFLHVVDLDGARQGRVHQTRLICEIVKATQLKVQAGGGVRSTHDVEQLLDAGAARVVVGSLAVTEPNLVKTWFKLFGGAQLLLAFDVQVENDIAQIMLKGWQDKSGKNLIDCIQIYHDVGLQTLLCTDISRDGMMGGANTALYAQLQTSFPQLDVLASGGIGSLEDLDAAKAAGAAGAIVGRALYEKRFTLEDAILRALNAG